VERTYDANPGEVWEENEFWIDLSWRIDPDGELGIRTQFESLEQPGAPIGVDEYYELLFTNSIPGLPEAAAEAGISPLEYMRRHGAFAIPGDQHAVHERTLTGAELANTVRGDDGVLRMPGTAGLHDDLGAVAGHMPFIGDGSRGVEVDGTPRTGFPTPSRKLELYSPTLAAWGWPEYATPTWIRSHVHWEDLDLDGAERILIPTFRLPTLIHTRSGNSKWLNEISHRHPLWIHPSDAERLGIDTGELARITTRTGHFVIETWRTEGIRPGVVACSHHMGRWRLDEQQGNERWSSGVADLEHDADRWDLRLRHGVEPFASADSDSSRVWWTDSGVHQNLTFPPQPDPVSGMHCWLQRVTVAAAEPGDRAGDVHADTAASMAAYEEWLQLTRPGPGPGNLRRPLWFARPVKPAATAYAYGRPTA
jgi:hypothetical protein